MEIAHINTQHASGEMRVEAKILARSYTHASIGTRVPKSTAGLYTLLYAGKGMIVKILIRIASTATLRRTKERAKEGAKGRAETVAPKQGQGQTKGRAETVAPKQGQGQAKGRADAVPPIT